MDTEDGKQTKRRSRILNKNSNIYIYTYKYKWNKTKHNATIFLIKLLYFIILL